MEPVLAIEIAGAPEGKRRAHPTIARSGLGQQYVKVFVDHETEAAMRHIAMQATVAMRAKGLQMLTGAIKIDILAIFPIPPSWSARKRAAALAGDIRPTVRPDFDNIEKLVTDAVKGVVWKDDTQVVDSRLQKFYGERPLVHFEVFT